MNAMPVKSGCSRNFRARVTFHLKQTALCRRNAQMSVVLLCAGLLKAFYSAARVDQLRWILAPTTWLVELFSGEVFRFEHYAGYMNDDRTFIIAAACAGVNFLITTFLLLSLTRLWSQQARIAWLFLPVAAGAAYLATIFANAVRITLALQLRVLSPRPRWMSADQLHRVEGILVYFGFLLFVFVLAERMSFTSASQRCAASSADGSSGKPIVKNNPLRPGYPLFKRLLFPVLIYYATTLGIPLLNGAYRQGGDFWQHSLFVLVVPLAVLLPLAGFVVIRERGIESHRH